MNATATAVPQRTRDDMGGMKVKGNEESWKDGLGPSFHLKHRKPRSVRNEHSVPGARRAHGPLYRDEKGQARGPAPTTST